MDSTLSDLQGFKTLCHETAHSLLHDTVDGDSRATKEVEAESTAFVVMHALGLDSAEDAIAAARRNAEKNGVQAEFGVANVFDWLNDASRAGEPLWDVIILDPPPFAKSKSALEGALRGYKEINLRALQRLAPGGILATYTCSHHMQDAELRGVLAAL